MRSVLLLIVISVISVSQFAFASQNCEKGFFEKITEIFSSKKCEVCEDDEEGYCLGAVQPISSHCATCAAPCFPGFRKDRKGVCRKVVAVPTKKS